MTIDSFITLFIAPAIVSVFCVVFLSELIKLFKNIDL